MGAALRNKGPFEVQVFFSESILEKHGDRNIRRVWTMDGFNDDRCFISFFGIENFIAKIDTYENHQMKRARQTDRSLKSLGNLQKLSGLYFHGSMLSFHSIVHTAYFKARTEV